MIESNSWLLSVIAVTMVVLAAVLYAKRTRKIVAQPSVRSMRHNKCWCCYNRTVTSSLASTNSLNKRTVSQELVKAFSCHSNSIESHSDNDGDDDDDDDSASLLLNSNYHRDKQFLHTIDFGQNCHRVQNTRLIPIEHVKNVIFNQNNLNYNVEHLNHKSIHEFNDNNHHDFRYNNNNNANNHHIIYESRHNNHFEPISYGQNYYQNFVPSDQSRCNSRFSNDNSRKAYHFPTSHSVSQDLFEAKRRLFRRQTSLSTEDGSQESYSHSTDFNPVPPSSRRPTNGLKQRAILGSISYKCNSKNSYPSPPILANVHSAHSPELKTPSELEVKPPNIDLISLAEKGRIGKQTSLEENSSEAGSNVEPVLTNAFRKKLTNRMLLRMRANNVSSESSNSFKDDEKPRGKFEAMRSFGSNECESDSISSQFNEPKDVHAKENEAKLKLLKSDKNCKMSFYGKLTISFAYDAPSKKLYIGVLQLTGENSTGKNRLCDVSKMYVQLTLLPSKRHKHKTKSKPIFGTTFMESFVFNRVSNSEIGKSGVRFRVYCQSVFSKKVQLVGECELLFSRTMPQQQETRACLELEPPKIIKQQHSDERSEVSSLGRTDSSSSQSLNATLPEILLGLSYNATTGRLSVTIIKGSQLRNSSGGGGSGSSSKAIDTYVKVSLLSSNGQEIARSKTSVCRGQPNPYFKETFMFQVALFQLVDVTLMLLTYSRRNIKRKDLIGWLSFGCNSSGDEQTAHWNDMQDKKGEQVLRWHILQQS